MASAQNSIQDPQTKVVQHNHIIIKYLTTPRPSHNKPCFGTTNRNYEKLY